MIIGILVIAATFSMMASNINGPAIVFAQVVNVAISGLPHQTAQASTQVPLTGSSDCCGRTSINIPGIGSGYVGNKWG